MTKGILTILTGAYIKIIWNMNLH